MSYTDTKRRNRFKDNQQTSIGVINYAKNLVIHFAAVHSDGLRELDLHDWRV